jgi:hypothetical protein
MIAEVESETIESSAPEPRLAPWDRNPYALVNRWDMAKFEGDIFCLICTNLRGFADQWETRRSETVSDSERATIVRTLKYIGNRCKDAGLHNAAGYIDDNMSIVEKMIRA